MPLAFLQENGKLFFPAQKSAVISRPVSGHTVFGGLDVAYEKKGE